VSDVPEISIVIPVRNAAATLGATIDSVRAQTFRHWELVAVDDGSSDASPALLHEFARSDPRMRVIIQPASGIVAALQRGCVEARGKFIARMDADDVMHPRRLEEQRRLLESHPDVGLVSCRVAFGGDRAAQTGYAVHVDWVNSLRTHEQMSVRRFVESPVAHPSVMFRRELLERHGGYAAGDFPEDYELWLRWLDAGVRFAKLEAELLTWNDPGDRLSRVDPRYSTESFYRVKCRYLARWLQRELRGERPVWLWGVGRVTRRRFESLATHGVNITGFIDIDPAKLGRTRDGRLVVSPEEIPPDAFVLVGVAVRGARELIVRELESQSRREGRDYLLGA